MSNWLLSLDTMFAKVWDILESGAVDGLPVGFATVSPDHWPEVRSVVLRQADRHNGVIEAYTDIESAKVESLAANPRAAFLYWNAELRLQVRMQATVKTQTGGAVATRWDNVPKHARSSYGVSPMPGSVIDGPVAYRKLSNKDQFAVLQCEIQTIDVVSLELPHRRAFARRKPSRAGDWVTNWLAP